MAPVILDTDIGTNVDDALALATLLGSPEVELVAVTTVYGDTTLRAQLARRLLRHAGRGPEVRVAPGATTPLSGADVWWAGHEGALHAGLEREQVDAMPAADVLIEVARARPGELHVLAVGPLTNLALALRREPGLATRVRRVAVMGGDFADAGRRAERNFRSDAVAAAEVLGSGLEVSVVGLDVTTTVRWGEPEAKRIGACGRFGIALQAELGAYWRHRGEPWSHPHDALAALLLLRPGLFGRQLRGLRVATGLEEAGLVVDDDAAPRRTVARTVDAAAAHEELLGRICRSARAGR